jgi:hypothetical protein
MLVVQVPKDLLATLVTLVTRGLQAILVIRAILDPQVMLVVLVPRDPRATLVTPDLQAILVIRAILDPQVMLVVQVPKDPQEIQVIPEIPDQLVIQVEQVPRGPQETQAIQAIPDQLEIRAIRPLYLRATPTILFNVQAVRPTLLREQVREIGFPARFTERVGIFPRNLRLGLI